jgi:hypothetical protein
VIVITVIDIQGCGAVYPQRPVCVAPGPVTAKAAVPGSPC